MTINPNREAEQSVLGGLILDPDKLPEVMGVLKPGQFLVPIHGAIYAAMLSLFRKNVRLDAVTVIDETVKGGVFSSREDASRMIVGLCETVPSTRNLMQYAALVADTARRSAAAALLGEIAEAVEAGGMDILQGLAGQLMTALSHSVRKDTWTAHDSFLDFYVSLKETPRFIPTGFLAVDKRARISPGDYVVVGGRPSTGKTALTLQIAAHIAKTKNVAYFSLETGQSKIMRRLVALGGGGTMPDLLDHNVDFDKVSKAGKQIRELKLHIVEASGWTVGQIRARAIQLEAEIIFIDYMGLIKAESGRSLYEQVTGISRDLHILAQQTGITVVALSQLSRNKDSREPTMQDLRESGQIEQDADIILLLHRQNTEDEQDTGRDLIIAKNKEGETGKLRFDFSGAGQKFFPEERRY